MTITVPVALGARSYEVVVGSGLIAGAGQRIAALPKVSGAAIVTDTHVGPLHGAALADSLARSGLHAPVVTVPAGEAAKSFAGLEALVSALLDAGLDRAGVVVALGGGVVGDLAGFAAAILKRGIRIVQVPTTLLAQVDSSVGGKTAIDTPQGKNLVGAFHQPSLVLADTGVLATLPARELRAGYAEVVKYGLLGDAAFFAWLEENGAAILSGECAARDEAIAASVRAKAAIVARDETETGDRMLLNLGHTFAHALETEAGFGERLLHGEAVAIGCVLAFRLSERLGHCAAGTAGRVARHLASAGLPVSPAERGLAPDPERLLGHMAHDKKNTGRGLTFILARGIGEAFIARDVPAAAVATVLAAD